MLTQMNKVIDYIEEHLCDDISLDEISQYAGIPDYDFRKIFFYLSGMTLNEYVKNRKLTEANKELLNNKKVTDIAYKYGYDSLDGFTRAFKKWSGFLPSEVAKKQICKSVPRLTFTLSVSGGTPMDVKLIDMPAFSFAGVSKRVPMQFEGVNEEILKLAQSITEEQRAAIHSLRNLDPKEIVNVSFDADANFQKEEGSLLHLIGVLTTEKTIPEILDSISVEACTWAVFPNEGPFPQTMQDTMARSYAEWLPSSDFALVKAPTFSFTKMNTEKENYAYSEIWVPVVKK